MGNAAVKDEKKSSRRGKSSVDVAGSDVVKPRKQQISQYLSEAELHSIAKTTHYTQDELRDLHFAYGFDSKNELTQHQLELILIERFKLQLKSKFVLERLFAVFDVDGSGAVDFKEFAQAVSKIERGSDEDKVKFVFELSDIDGNGEIDRDELRQFIAAIHDDVAAQAIVHFSLDTKKVTKMGGLDAWVDDFFVDADVDGDGAVSFPEYKRVMIEKNYFNQLHLTDKELAAIFERKSGSHKSIFVIGPPCCGKKTVCKAIESQFGTRSVGMNELVQARTRVIKQKSSLHRTNTETQLNSLDLSISLGVAQLAPPQVAEDSDSGSDDVSQKVRLGKAASGDDDSTELGARAKSFTESNQDIPDEIALRIVTSYIEDMRKKRKQPKSKKGSKKSKKSSKAALFDSVSSDGNEVDEAPRGWMIHGFPRTKGQLMLLDQEGVIPHKIVVLNCSDDKVLAERLEKKLRRVVERSAHWISEADLDKLRARFRTRLELWRESRANLLKFIQAEGESVLREFDVLKDGSIILDSEDPKATRSLCSTICAFIEEGEVRDDTESDADW